MTAETAMPAKIALVADSPGWVFSRIADRIRERLGDRHDVRIVLSSQLAGLEDLVAALFDADDGYDLIHFFWRESLSDLFRPETWLKLIKSFDTDALKRLKRRTASTRKTTWVCDHLFLNETLESLWNRRCLSYASSYGVSSKILERIYSGISPEAEIHELQDGVDLELFGVGRHVDRPPGDMVFIGWSGNSEWGKKDQDHKGLNTIIKPAIARLRAARLPVRHRFCDRSHGWTPFEEMPQYYRSIDIFTCASTNEGTPNTILEAMACGLPIVSTRVGIVDEAFGPLQRQFIVDSRSVNLFEDKLRTLVENPALRARLGAENLARVTEWDWTERIGAWERFIEAALKRERDPQSTRDQLSVLSRSIEIARERLALG